MRALQAATRDAAQISRPGTRVGVLAQGWQADVLVVDGDPLTDLDSLRRVQHVMVGGHSTTALA
jgi:imidazolonepropionase-like amidohydrolase